jgi:hypothetical protein
VLICYCRTLLTLCPSASTRSVLQSNDFSDIRLWPRGVDLSQFSPAKRSASMRASWGLSTSPTRTSTITTATMIPQKQRSLNAEVEHMIGVNYKGRKSSLPITPPDTPAFLPEIGEDIGETLVLGESAGGITVSGLQDRVVILYVGRM